MNWFGQPCTIEFQLSDVANRKTVEVINEKGKTERPFLFFGHEGISGKVFVSLSKSKRIEHTGIKIEFVGDIEMFYDRGSHYEFISVVQELAPPGELSDDKTFEFNFTSVEALSSSAAYESHNGINVKLRYFIRFSITRNLVSNVTKEYDIWIHNYQSVPEISNAIKLEVGIEDCLHIEFEYNKSKYHLRDVVIGKVYFLLVRIHIRHMEIELIKRESSGSGSTAYNETEKLTKFELMDYAPVRGESIPIRMFLGAFGLTPTYKNVHNKFSVKYFLNLVLVDVDDRRYYKQQEIILWRKMPGSKSLADKKSDKGLKQADNLMGPDPKAAEGKSDLFT